MSYGPCGGRTKGAIGRRRRSRMPVWTWTGRSRTWCRLCRPSVRRPPRFGGRGVRHPVPVPPAPGTHLGNPPYTAGRSAPSVPCPTEAAAPECPRRQPVAAYEPAQQHRHIRALRPVVRMELVEHHIREIGALPQRPVLGTLQQQIQHLLVGDQHIRRRPGCVVRLVHGGHPALADLLLDAVTPARQCHACPDRSGRPRHFVLPRWPSHESPGGDERADRPTSIWAQPLEVRKGARCFAAGADDGCLHTYLPGTVTQTATRASSSTGGCGR